MGVLSRFRMKSGVSKWQIILKLLIFRFWDDALGVLLCFRMIKGKSNPASIYIEDVTSLKRIKGVLYGYFG